MSSLPAPNFKIGVGATTALSLRVSVATLVRVLFERPTDGESMLALERKATLLAGDSRPVVEVKSQPFGGAIRIRDLAALRDLIGDYHFDSERSRSEQDFRIFIRASDWPPVRQVCLRHFSQVDDPVLETDPGRELAEEFGDALAIGLEPDQYRCQPVGTVVESDPARTENIHAEGYPTARVYRIFEVRIKDLTLSRTLLENSGRYADQDLHELAWADVRNGGKGRANAVLALPMKRVSAVYFAMPPSERNVPIFVEQHRLDETVAALLDGLSVPKYHRLA